MYSTPLTLLPDLDWQDVLRAIGHEERGCVASKMMAKLPSVEHRLTRSSPCGIFVVHSTGAAEA